MKLLGKYATVLALVSVFSLTSTAEAANFTATTSLSIHVSRKHIQSGQKVKIYGRLTSNRHSCVNRERIKLWAKKVGGVWKPVARTRTAENGAYKFVRRPTKTTRFKTKYRGKTTGVHPNELTCSPSVSAVRRVRVS